MVYGTWTRSFSHAVEMIVNDGYDQIYGLAPSPIFHNIYYPSFGSSPGCVINFVPGHGFARTK